MEKSMILFFVSGFGLSALFIWKVFDIKHESETKKIKQKEEFNPETDQLLNLLYNIAEDQAKHEGYIHRGITCNNCANCIDYDICEQCESEECHIRTHVFLKIRIPIPPLSNPRSSLLNVFYPGNHLEMTQLHYETIKELQKKTHFDKIELQALYEQFKSLSKTDNGIDKITFQQCLGPLGLEKNLITDRIFNFFDQDRDDLIDFGEMVCGLSVLCKGTLEEKIKYAFAGFDLDEDGFITRIELQRMLRAYFYLSMELVRDVVRAVEEELIENFDEKNTKPVSSVFTAQIPNHSNSKITNRVNGGIFNQVLDSISQEAIDDLAQRTFENLDKTGKGKISFDDFREYVETDSTMIAWFDSLGSVF